MWFAAPFKSNLPMLLGLRCTHVLNASDFAPAAELTAQYEAAQIAYRQLDGIDSVSFDMRALMPAALEFAETSTSGGEGLLVHCMAGINRSGFLVVALLMLRERISVLDAVGRVKSARGTVLLNSAFQIQLLEVAREHQLLEV